MTKGYLFKDERDAEHPYALFIENLDDEDGVDRGRTIEVRLASVTEAIVTLYNVMIDLGEIDMELGEPAHFEAKRNSDSNISEIIEPRKEES